MQNSFFHFLQNRFHINLNEQQKSAVLHKDGPAIVLAVPGAGKTTMLICRTAYLILYHKIRPEQILSITFSKASAKDMSKRFASIFGPAVHGKVPFSTIHGFAYKLIREYGRKHQIQYTLIEGEQVHRNKTTLLKQLYYQISGSYISDDQLEDLISAISYIKNAMIPLETYCKEHRDIDHLPEIYTQYESYKRRHYFLDFDDMLSIALEILRKDDALLQYCRQRYPYIQVDEAQDTSKVQHEIIRLLAGSTCNLFMVADDDQSIYGFRGAYPEMLLRFQDTYPGAISFFMEQNYRCPKDIVEISDAFIQTNQTRYPKKLFSHHENQRGMQIIALRDEQDQLNYLIDQLSGHDDLSNVAILYRNNLSAITLADKLDRHGIPFYIRDSKNLFFRHWVVQDILSFLRLSLDFSDFESLERIYYKMNGYIPKTAIQYSKMSHYISVFDRLLNFPEFRSYQRDNIHRICLSFTELAALPPKDALGFIEYSLNYRAYLESHYKNGSLDGIDLILSQLKIMARGTDSIQEFLYRFEDLQKIMEASQHNRYENAVILSTIHSAKGLEFDRVLMIDLFEQHFPTKSSIELARKGDLSILEEERRLFYVGMTRAKKSLGLLIVKLKNGELMKVSRFVEEVSSCAEKLHLHRIFLDQNLAPSLKTMDTPNHPFSIGSKVIHPKFGIGEVQELRSDILTVCFDSVGSRDLSLKLCLEKQILFPA
ncbi:DNA helicase-2/ATP-dependent DNA helicase PcrA [Anaerosolibacter carboniphilus]|uniref:DNA 3'-5' helicase n=1 Tax=Anaerosolibacter carboniphilus TaxID=1417629 RepID=A0A841L7R7_9FIRM|nr:ATP-dependent helicase [Anaerosolibacter carboniphilus]MBB6218439.1 DNA helicase-2/ATP-dependent DNA helicase PcrA [Anaerosolibacter carboniphilus]